PEKYDADLYLTPEQIQQMNYFMDKINSGPLTSEEISDIFSGANATINEQIKDKPTNGSYAHMLAACFKAQRIKPDAVLCAHDHALVYNRTNELCQIISGAGGSTNLMQKETDANDASMGCYLTEPGFVTVTCLPGKKLEFIYRDTANHELTFNNSNHTPVSTNFPEATPSLKC